MKLPNHFVYVSLCVAIFVIFGSLFFSTMRIPSNSTLSKPIANDLQNIPVKSLKSPNPISSQSPRLFKTAYFRADKPEFLTSRNDSTNSYLCYSGYLDENRIEPFVELIKKNINTLYPNIEFDYSTLVINPQEYFYEVSIMTLKSETVPSRLVTFNLMNCSTVTIYSPIKLQDNKVVFARRNDLVGSLKNEDFLRFVAFIKSYDILELGYYGLTMFDDLVKSDFSTVGTTKKLSEVYSFHNGCDYDGCKLVKFQRNFEIVYDSETGEFVASFE